MYKLKNNIFISVISFVTIFISIFLINKVEREYYKWADTYLNTYISDIEIMTTNYYENRHLTPRKDYLYNYSDYIKIIKSVVNENDVASILKYNGYILSPKYEYSVIINGIESEKYRLLFPSVTNIKSGKYIDKYVRNSCIIGSDVALKLNLKAGDRFILRLLDVNNLYKAEEFIVSGIFESGNEYIDKKNMFVNISILNELVADKYAFSSIYIKSFNNKNIYAALRKLFSDDIGIYTKYDIYSMLMENENTMLAIKRYIYMIFFVVAFAFYFYINSKAFSVYKLDNFNSTIILNILFSLAGFLLSCIVLLLFLNVKYSTNFTLLFILNTLLIFISSVLPYTITKKRVL